MPPPKDPEKRRLYSIHLSESLKGKNTYKKSPEHCEKIRQSLLGRFAGEDNPNYGKVMPEETRRKIGEKAKGRPVSNETREKHRVRMIGNTYSRGVIKSRETRRKLSVSLKGKPCPTKGRPLSDAHKKKISDALSGQYC